MQACGKGKGGAWQAQPSMHTPQDAMQGQAVQLYRRVVPQQPHQLLLQLLLRFFLLCPLRLCLPAPALLPLRALLLLLLLCLLLPF